MTTTLHISRDTDGYYIADQDGNGSVDAGDTGMIQARFGQSCPGG